MIGTEKISSRQMFFVVMISSIGINVYFHSFEYKIVGRAAPVFLNLSSIIIILLLSAIWYVSTSYPGYTVLQVIEDHMGRFAGGIFSAIYILIAIAISVLLLKLFTSMVGTFILIHTPGWFIMLILLILCLYIASRGIEVQARMISTMVPLLLLMLYSVTAIALIGKQFDFSNLLPIFDLKPGGITNGIYAGTAGLCEGVFNILIIIAALANPSTGLKPMVAGMAASMLALVGVAGITMLGILGYESIPRLAYGTPTMGINISLGEFIQGIEVLLLVIYEFYAIIKITMNIYCAWTTAFHMFGNRFSRILLPVMGITVFLAALRIGSFSMAQTYAFALARYIELPFIVITITLALVLMKIRKGRRVSKAK